MIYIYHKYNLYLVFTNLKAISNHTGYNYDTLKYHFSRLKKTTYKDGEVTITKKELIKR